MNIDNLRQAMETKNINISELAKMAKVGQATISEILSGVRKDVRLETAKKIAGALEIPLENIM